MQYFYLAVAIAAEVTATTFLKQADGFTKLMPSLVTITGYVLAFWFLSLSIRTLPTSIAYAVWSGAGIMIIAAAAWLFQGQKPDVPAICGIILIVTGIIVLTLFSKMSTT